MPGQLDPADRHAVEQLVHDHAWLIDHGHADQVARLYTADAHMVGFGPDKAGHAAITEWADQRAAMTQRRSRHVQSNIRLHLVAPDRVVGTMVLTLYRHDGAGPASAAALLIADCDDAYQRGTDGLWRFAERRLTVIFGG